MGIYFLPPRRSESFAGRLWEKSGNTAIYCCITQAQPTKKPQTKWTVCPESVSAWSANRIIQNHRHIIIKIAPNYILNNSGRF
mgnify:CR=1 FL=1